jgi:hypothetical protein
VSRRGADFVAGKVGGGVKVYFCDCDGFVAGGGGVGGGVGNGRGGEEESGVVGDVDASVVEEGGARIFD